MADEEHALALALGTGSSPGTTTRTVEVTLAGAAGRRTSDRTERARRQTMSALYAELGALLPDLPARASRSEIVEKAIAYVRALEDTAAELETRRAASAGRSRSRARDGSAEVVASGETSCFAVRLCAARPGALTRVLEVFRRHRVPVLAATVVRDGTEAAVTVTTAAVPPVVSGKIEADIVGNA